MPCGNFERFAQPLVRGGRGRYRGVGEGPRVRSCARSVTAHSRPPRIWMRAVQHAGELARAQSRSAPALFSPACSDMASAARFPRATVPAPPNKRLPAGNQQNRSVCVATIS